MLLVYRLSTQTKWSGQKRSPVHQYRRSVIFGIFRFDSWTKIDRYSTSNDVSFLVSGRCCVDFNKNLTQFLINYFIMLD